jgi:hypothetical protein
MNMGANMIITDRFIFWHLPKCAGTTTRNILSTVFKNEIISDSSREPGMVFHRQDIPQQFTNDKERDWIINFRRLPAFLLSKTNHTYREMLHNSNKIIDPARCKEVYLEGYTYQREREITADEVLEPYQYIFDNPNTKIIRQEHYKDDLIKVLKEYDYDLPYTLAIAEPESGYQGLTETLEDAQYISRLLKRGQGKEMKLIQKIDLDKDQLIKIRQTNPNWSNLERRLYHDNN